MFKLIELVIALAYPFPKGSPTLKYLPVFGAVVPFRVRVWVGKVKFFALAYPVPKGSPTHKYLPVFSAVVPFRVRVWVGK